MSKDFSPDRLDVKAFAQAGARLAGTDPLSMFTRLVEEAQGPVDAAVVQWQAEGEWQTETGGDGHVWLHLQVRGQLPMVCQRCLQLADIPLDVERSFCFVKDEATAEALDEELEEDVLVLSREFDLRALVEDELLMELPVVPMHEHCPGDVPMQSSDDDFESANTQKPHPFAALAGLRKPGGAR